MSAFPDMRLIAAPIAARLMVIEVIRHWAIVALDSVAGQCPVIARDEDERLIGFASTC